METNLLMNSMYFLL